MATSYWVAVFPFAGLSTAASIFNDCDDKIVKILEIDCVSGNLYFRQQAASCFNFMIKRDNNIALQRGSVLNPDCVKNYTRGHLKGITVCNSAITTSIANACLLYQTRLIINSSFVANFMAPEALMSRKVYQYSNAETQPLIIRKGEVLFSDTTSGNYYTTIFKFSIEDI